MLCVHLVERLECQGVRGQQQSRRLRGQGSRSLPLVGQSTYVVDSRPAHTYMCMYVCGYLVRRHEVSSGYSVSGTQPRQYLDDCDSSRYTVDRQSIGGPISTQRESICTHTRPGSLGIHSIWLPCRSAAADPCCEKSLRVLKRGFYCVRIFFCRTASTPKPHQRISLDPDSMLPLRRRNLAGFIYGASSHKSCYGYQPLAARRYPSEHINQDSSHIEVFSNVSARFDK